MKKLLIFSITISLGLYFLLTSVVFPQIYLQKSLAEPSPVQSVQISNKEISLGESFSITVDVTNQDDFADILITSIGFPTLPDLDAVRITSYDFTQSPRLIQVGDSIGTKYTKGAPMQAVYPSIEAMSRNVYPDSKFFISISVTPQNIGPFVIYVKTIAIPHLSDLAHYPYEGLVDPQGEFVQVQEITVKPKQTGEQ